MMLNEADSIPLALYIYVMMMAAATAAAVTTTFSTRIFVSRKIIFEKGFVCSYFPKHENQVTLHKHDEPNDDDDDDVVNKLKTEILYLCNVGLNLWYSGAMFNSVKVCII